MANSQDIQLLTDCRRLHDIFKVDARYNPSNKRLLIPALETALTGGYPIVENISVKLASWKLGIDHRQEVYERAVDFAKKSRRYLKSSGATEAEIADAQTYLRPLLGGIRKKKTTAAIDPNTPAAKVINTHDALQESYASMYADLVAYRQFIGKVSAYNPNEAGITLAAADALIAEALAATETVSQTFAPLSTAWDDRDQKLYTDETSILNDFRAAKEYYKSLYDAKDPEYRSVTAIKLIDNSRPDK